MCNRELCCHFSVDLITDTYRNFIQITKYIQNRKCNICCTLQATAILGSNTVKPSHSSRTSCSCTKLTAITTAASQLISFVSEDLGYKCTTANCGRICLADCDDLLDLVWWDTCTDCTVSCQCGRRSYHWVNSMIRIL